MLGTGTRPMQPGRLRTPRGARPAPGSSLRRASHLRPQRPLVTLPRLRSSDAQLKEILPPKSKFLDFPPVSHPFSKVPHALGRSLHTGNESSLAK